MSATAQIEPPAPAETARAAPGGAIARVEPITTARALRGPFDYALGDELRGEVDVGSMLVVPFGRRQLLGVVVGLSDASDVPAERLLAPVRALALGLPDELVALARWIADEYCSTLARALMLVLPPDARKRLSGRRRRAASPPRHLDVGASSPHAPSLTADQRQALAPLLAALDSRAHRQMLLHGVTGSGKTEVYLQAAAATLAQGRGAIVLVPEISLTPQIVARFRERFGETVAVLHSRLTPGQRYQEWRRLREGQARICVGPRSAVFAPVADLGLIVVDEEHDSSYKHEGDPRYDARDVAARRAEQAGALLVAGSATPRAESVHRLTACKLGRRVDGRPLPDVEILDMRGLQAGLHPSTAQALADVRSHGGKAIVLLNRRGWSNFLSCRSCGRVWGCPECDVALVLHRAGGPALPARSSEAGCRTTSSERGAGCPAGHFIACHHCGHRELVPHECPDCGSTAVARHGAGTERLQHDLAGVLDEDGDFPVFRLDADVVAQNGGAEGTGAAAVLQAFGQASRGALIGTQIVAKGHDFPDVTLGVVLDADATLRFPDFRAEERTFSLIAQLAGRAGRGAHGRVLVQTIAPQARAIVAAAAHDSDGFLAGELQRRRALRYPPFSHLIRIVCADEQAERARAAAARVRELAVDRIGPAGDATVLGPASLFRLRGRERQVLVVKAAQRRAAVRAVGEAVAIVAGERAHAGVSFSVDVDPQ